MYYLQKYVRFIIHPFIMVLTYFTIHPDLGFVNDDFVSLTDYSSGQHTDVACYYNFKAFLKKLAKKF